uniref:hypothetical protein n=1 Tax=Microbacterium proteolyticum TaxID=1572644 RepID=UPI0024169EB3|nr:hypothetical protein [Microbacterium proteolyticum]
MDISETLAPKSAQLDYEDFLGGPKTLTVQEVRKGPSDEQPIEVVFIEADRPWRPAKTVRRLLVACWGSDASVYPGRKVTLFGDPKVKWGGVEIGDIRLSHASHIDGPLRVALQVTRGKRDVFTVEPLKADPLIELLQSADTLDALKAAWEQVTRQGKSNLPELIQVKDARKAALTSGTGVTA